MNILYFAALNVQDETKIGIKNKIMGQCKALKQLGHSVWLVCFRDNKAVVTKAEELLFEYYVGEGNTRRRCNQAFRMLRKVVMDWEIDLFYIRLPSMCLSTYQFLKFMHKQNIKVVIELYTFPLNKERLVSTLILLKQRQFLLGGKAVVSLLVDNLYYPFLKRVVDRLVVLLPKKKIWGIKTIQVQNGIDTASIIPRTINTRKDTVTLLGVAYLSYWHGYDRVLKGLKAYYEDGNPSKMRVEFIIAGDGEHRKKLETYVYDNHLESYVSFVGVKTGPELDSYYNRADVGIAALGVHRKNLRVVSTLKSREYFAKGLPFLTSAMDYGISNKVSKYCLKVPNDDSDISIDEVVKFASQFKDTEEAKTVMRKYAEQFMDWKYQMSTVIKGVADVN